MHRILSVSVILILAIVLISNPLFSAEKDVLLNAMEEELERAFGDLKDVGEAPLYYLNYSVVEETDQNITAEFGGIVREDESRNRYLDVDVRVGSMELDNTHEIRDEGFGSLLDFDFGMSVDFPIENSPDVIKHALWLATDEEFKKAQKKYIKVKRNVAVKVEAEDTSPDFSPAEPQVYIGELANKSYDMKVWKEKVRKFSEIYSRYDQILDSQVSLTLENENKYIVNSDGTKLRFGLTHVRISTYGLVKADDGMNLHRFETFEGSDISELPSDDVIESKIISLIEDLIALRDAPMVEPYEGPAILRNRASGVFFHEIFGHRIEGQRQKNESEGQTFAKKVGEQVLPEYISVYEDPSQKYYNGEFLYGYYEYDDEGVKPERVTVVENGILKNFLLSRTMVEGFTKSNGHGRRNHGNKIVSRQGNLIIESSKMVPFEELRAMLIDECKNQGKEWGLIFEDISGGFTMTMKFLPQAFKVMPLKVWRVYTDGRPDELVRGVDIVGTPLTSFSKITATGDDYAVFNGLCGAESGMVPVSAISPSILVSQIEIEKKAKSQEKPPVLPPPEKRGN
ncbi:TldD/PmbA family protein [bacterium]|nr:TldD/PmbA family protein [bacterium]